MFRRLLIEQWTTIFTLIAFCTALSVYVSVTWRALRMRRPQLERLAAMPLQDEPASPHHE